MSAAINRRQVVATASLALAAVAVSSALPAAAMTITSPRVAKLTFDVVARELDGFDGDAFVRNWSRIAGSVHRHYATGELVLLYSPVRVSPEREAAAAELQRPGVAGAVLAAIDRRDARIDGMLSGALPAGPLR